MHSYKTLVRLYIIIGLFLSVTLDNQVFSQNDTLESKETVTIEASHFRTECGRPTTQHSLNEKKNESITELDGMLIHKSYFENGVIHTQSEVVLKVINDTIEVFSPDCYEYHQYIIQEIDYIHSGKHIEYAEDGQITVSGSFTNGLKNGEWKHFTKGELIGIENYKMGIKIED